MSPDAIVFAVIIVLMLIWNMYRSVDGYAPNLSQSHKLVYGGVPIHGDSVLSSIDPSRPTMMAIPNSMMSLRQMQKDAMPPPDENHVVGAGSTYSDMLLSKTRSMNRANPRGQSASTTKTRGLQVRSIDRASHN